MLDHLGSLDVLIAFGAEDAARERIRQADAAVRRAIVRRALGQAGTAAVVSLLAGVASVAALVVTAPQYAEGSLAAPLLAVAVLVPMAVFEVFGSVQQYGFLCPVLRRRIASVFPSLGVKQRGCTYRHGEAGCRGIGGFGLNGRGSFCGGWCCVRVVVS